MVIAKQMEVRSNIKEYFDMAYDGEVIIVPRKQNRNVVIISETEYNAFKQLRRIEAYHQKLMTPKSTIRAEGGSLKQANFRKLDQIEKLSDGWNGNGAPAVPIEVIEKTRRLLESLPIQPDLFPTALKSIQLEFDNSGHDHMELEINISDNTEVFIVSCLGEETEETITSDTESITKRVMQFYG